MNRFFNYSLLVFICSIIFVNCTAYEDSLERDNNKVLMTLNTVQELANDNGIKFTINPDLNLNNVTEKELDELEKLFVGLSGIKGKYKMQLRNKNDRCASASQLRRAPRKRNITCDAEWYDPITYDFRPQQASSGNYYGNYDCICYCSAIWVYAMPDHVIVDVSIDPCIEANPNNPYSSNFDFEEFQNDFIWFPLNNGISFNGTYKVYVYSKSTHACFGVVSFDYTGLCDIDSGMISWM